MTEAPPPLSLSSTDGVQLRLARPGDAPALIALETASFNADRLQPRQWRYLLRQSSAEIWVEEGASGDGSEDGPEIPPLRAALVLLFRRGSYLARIYSLATAKKWRGYGLASALLALAERRARVRGCDRLALEVRQDNAVALTLYQRAGFIIRRRLPGYYADGSDGLRLERSLACHPGIDPERG